MNVRLVLRAGHPYTQDFSFRPDGLILATVGTQQAGVHFWEVRGARPLGVWHGHPRLQGLRLSQDRLLSWGDGRACLWDSSPLHRGSLEFSLLKDYRGEDGRLGSRRFLLGGPSLRLGDSRSGQVLLEVPGERWFHLGPRGRRIVVGQRLISGVSGRQIHLFDSACALAAFSPEERWLAVSGYSDRFLTLVDLDREQTFRHEAHSCRIVALAFSPEGLYLASADEQGQLTVVDLESGRSQCLESGLGSVAILSWLGLDRLTLGDATGAYRLVEVAPEGLRASSLVAGPLESGRGRWLQGPDGLAAWTQASHLSVFHLATGQTIGQLPPPLREEPRVRQHLVGRTVLVEGVPWDLQRGKVRAGGPLAVLGGRLVGRVGLHYQLEELQLEAPAEVPHLRAAWGSRSFAFSDGSGQRLEIWRRDAQGCTRWRTAPWLPGNPQDLHFSSSGQLLGWRDGQGGSYVWNPEANRLFPVSGSSLLLVQGWLEADASGLVQLRDGQGNVRRQAPGGPWRWMFAGPQSIVLVCAERAEVWDLSLESLKCAWQLPGLVAAQLTEDGQFLLGAEASGDVSLWRVSDGSIYGVPQPFHPQDIPHLELSSGHGLAFACAGRDCGCWRLQDGSFEWIRFGEPWFGGLSPLQDGRLLLFTQDGSWHLYAGRPWRRLASLSTAQHEGYLVLSESGAWDSSPELYSRVVLESGRQAPSPEKDLWETLMCGRSFLPAVDREASPDPA